MKDPHKPFRWFVDYSLRNIQPQDKETEFLPAHFWTVCCSRGDCGFRAGEQEVNSLRQSCLMHIVTNLLFAAPRLDQDGKVPDFMGDFV